MSIKHDMSREKRYVNIMYRHEVTVELDKRFENCKEICNLTEQKSQCIGNVLSFTPALKFSSTCSIVRVPTRTGKPGKMGRHFPVREF